MSAFFNKFMQYKLVLLALLFLSGCVSLGGTSKPTNFYTLSSMEKLEERDILLSNDIDIDFYLVELPDYLARPQIVTRVNEYRIELGDFDRWAGDLKTEMSLLMVRELKHKLSTERVFVFPKLLDKQAGYQVKVSVVRFDGVLGGKVILQGSWALFGGKRHKELVYEDFMFSANANGMRYVDMVATLSHLLTTLADSMAATILRQP